MAHPGKPRNLLMKMFILKVKRCREKLKNMSVLIVTLKKRQMQVLLSLLALMQNLLQQKEVHRSCYGQYILYT